MPVTGPRYFNPADPFDGRTYGAHNLIKPANPPRAPSEEALEFVDRWELVRGIAPKYRDSERTRLAADIDAFAAQRLTAALLVIEAAEHVLQYRAHSMENDYQALKDAVAEYRRATKITSTDPPAATTEGK